MPQTISRNMPPRQRVVKFPATTRFDTVWASYGHSPTPLSGHLNVGFTVDSGPSLDDAIRRVSAGTVPIATHLEGKADRVSDGSVRGAQIVRHASAHIRHASLHAPQCSGA
jgi:hypothetical protein